MDRMLNYLAIFIVISMFSIAAFVIIYVAWPMLLVILPLVWACCRVSDMADTGD